jgi:hypothetical protein
VLLVATDELPGIPFVMKVIERLSIYCFAKPDLFPPPLEWDLHRDGSMHGTGGGGILAACRNCSAPASHLSAFAARTRTDMHAPPTPDKLSADIIPAAMLKIADWHARCGDKSKAERYYRWALERDPGNPHARQQLNALTAAD